MLYYRGHSAEASPPPWLSGAQGIVRYESERGPVYTVEASSVMLGLPSLKWETIDGGFQVGVAGELTQDYIAIIEKTSQKFGGAVAVCDHMGRAWSVPKIMDAKGNRLYSPPLCGADFRPCPSAWQLLGEESASQCRDLIGPILAGEQPCIPAMARWVSQALACQYHLPRQVFALAPIFDVGFLVAATAVLADREGDLS